MDKLEHGFEDKLARAEAAGGIPRGLSIITPADPARLEHFDATAESVERLRAVAEFAVEWVLCLDGPAGSVKGPDIVLALPTHRGQATARNWALTHATGDLVFTLDADDEVMPEGLIVGCEILSNEHDLGWVAGTRLTQYGERLWHPMHEEEFNFAAGDTSSILDSWLAPFPPNTIVARRRLMLTIGGWPAVPTGEDFAMAVNLNGVAAGRFVPQVFATYRKWDGQLTREHSFKHEKAMVRKFLVATRDAAARD